MFQFDTHIDTYKCVFAIKKFIFIGQMSSFKFLFFGWLFASQKKREMHSISRPEFAMQTLAFQGSAIALFLRYASELATPALTILATV